MLSITQCNNGKEVELLAQTIADSLEENGFSQSDLIATATIIIDHAIKLIEKNPNQSAFSKPHS
ncbi:MAG: hypothetical protein GY786_10970 [Proteobacteria bacterium]|nr:hypothetical protein [Pseudomonadota bacterium]